MKYSIDYQYFPIGATRPQDDGQIVGITGTHDTGTVLLPVVGDYVHIDNSVDGGQRSNFSGKVRSRLFTYIRVGSGDEDIMCGVNIVVEETNDDFGQLIKE